MAALPGRRVGAYVVLEGIDGAGTTTHSRLLAEGLQALGYCACLLGEPSRGEIGGLIRRALAGGPFSQRLLALLFAADRLEQAGRVRECLSEGCVAVGDRSWVSSLAYQSYDGFPDPAPLDWVYTLNRYAPRPDVLVFLDVDPLVAYRRIVKRAGRELPERLSHLQGLARQYERVIEILAGLVPVIVRVKGTVKGYERPIDSVSRDVLTAVLAALNYRGLKGDVTP